MSAFPNSPRLVKGGIVLVDSDSGAVQKIILVQYNPDTHSTARCSRKASRKARQFGSVAVNKTTSRDNQA